MMNVKWYVKFAYRSMEKNKRNYDRIKCSTYSRRYKMCGNYNSFLSIKYPLSILHVSNREVFLEEMVLENMEMIEDESSEFKFISALPVIKFSIRCILLGHKWTKIPIPKFFFGRPTIEGREVYKCKCGRLKVNE